MTTVTVLLLVLFPSVAWAQTTYYVDNTDGAASDSNPGSESSPWPTICVRLRAVDPAARGRMSLSVSRF